MDVERHKGRWRCRMPEFFRSVFQRTFQHPWQNTERIAPHQPKQGEQWCPRCHAVRHHLDVVRLVARDLYEVDWQPGRHPRYSLDPDEVLGQLAKKSDLGTASADR